MPDPRLHSLLAQARVAELRGAAAGRSRALGPAPPEGRPRIEEAITLRYGFPDDAEAIGRLAALDSGEVPRAPILLAEVAGELRAALSLADGNVVAHPFYATRTLVQLLGARAQQLRQADGSDRRIRAWRWGRARLSALR